MPEGSKVSVFDGFRRVRLCSGGFDGTGSGNRVPETRGIKKVPGSGDSVPKVPKVTFYFERALLYFESILCKIKSKLSYFESILVYIESILLYFATMLASGCIENQYGKGKEKVVINVHSKHANLLVIGDTTYAYGDQDPYCVGNCEA